MGESRLKGWFVIRGFVFGFVVGFPTSLFLGGVALYAFAPEPGREQEKETADVLRFGDFFDYQTDFMGGGRRSPTP